MSDNYKMPSAYNGNEPYIFISYSHRDADKVLPIIKGLNFEGYRVWYDDGIDPGTEYADFIADKLLGCSVFIAMVSKNFIASEFCKDELNLARDEKIRCLLVYLEDLTLPSGMQLRFGRLQALFKHKHYSENDFYDRLFKVDGMNDCLGEACCEEDEEFEEEREEELASSDLDGFEIENNILVKYHGNDADVVIPDGVTEIGEEAFENCESLENVTIPDSITDIGDKAFAGCIRLREVNIPGSVQEMGHNVFTACFNLESVTFSYGVKKIKSCSFCFCDRLKKVTIPNSVIEIEADAFRYVGDNLKTVTVPKNCRIGKNVCPDTCTIIRR